MRPTLVNQLQEMDLPLPAETAELLCRFGEAVVKQNEVMSFLQSELWMGKL